MEKSAGFSNYTCAEFIDALASKAPVPGGGGASALVGAIGAALGHMVGSLTLGKGKYASVQDDINRLNDRAAGLQAELLELITQDAMAFEPLSRAYGLPHSTDEERAEKVLAMDGALKSACATPLEIMQKCGETIELIREYAAKGTAIAISDAGCGALFCKAALQAASLNIYINTKSMADRPYADELNARADRLLDTYTAMADEIYRNVSLRVE
jgi:formiminotetrahydrofolate cyclodeaminase